LPKANPLATASFSKASRTNELCKPRFAAARGYSFALSATSIKLSYNSVDR
jgi:hypothetical protein